MQKNPTSLKLVCSHCLSVNRVPVSRKFDSPVCGKCKQTLLPSHPIDLTDDTFTKFVSKTEVPVVVDFWAPWCGPCRMMAPAFAQAASQLASQVVLAKLNTENSPLTSSRFAISGIPTMILFRNGRELSRQSGALDADQIVQWVSSSIR